MHIFVLLTKQAPTGPEKREDSRLITISNNPAHTSPTQSTHGTPIKIKLEPTNGGGHHLGILRYLEAEDKATSSQSLVMTAIKKS